MDTISYSFRKFVFLLICFICGLSLPLAAQIGVGASPIEGASLYFDGSRASLDKNWAYWDGPRLAASLPIKWEIVDNPAGDGFAVSSNDPAAAGGKYGAADIVTKDKFRDFRAHVEFFNRQ